MKATNTAEHANLFEQPPLLNNVCNCLLFDTFRFLDVLESVELFGPPVFNHPDLWDKINELRH